MSPECYFAGTGGTLASDGQSLYFMVNLNALIPIGLQNDQAGKLLGAHTVPGNDSKTLAWWFRKGRRQL